MRWLRREGPLPRHPYRDSAIVYGVLAVVIVGVTLLTGGGLARGFLVAIAFFVLATGYSWWRFHQQLQRERR